MNHLFPSIWLEDFHSKSEFDANSPGLAQSFRVFDWLDDRVLHSRHGFSYPAYCSTCGHVTEMQVDWTYGAAGNSTSINPAWTETARCPECGLNSRMRALMDYLITHIDLEGVKRGYVAEQTTPSFQALKKIVPGLIGSEYLGADLDDGKVVTQWSKARRVRHEDLTHLSLPGDRFDLAVTQDVFEHVPDYQAAFLELHRILRPGGQLVFTVPFFYDLERTRIRASIEGKNIIHHLPAEIHGNPVSKEGSLCFQNFGWDLLSDLGQADFINPAAHLYWGPWQGHLGYPFFVFSAEKE